MKPFRFEPQFVSKIWGGRRLETALGKNIPEGKIGESWEISGHPANLTRVADGQHKGLSLYDLAGKFGEEVFGRHSAQCREEFPLLYKFIDAADVLSVQVHPDDEYASMNENSLGKSESWVIVDCEPGAVLYRGFKQGSTLADFDALLGEGRLEEILRPVTVEPGDCIDLPARTVHAIGSGILLAEVQQSSDVTYRVYDWNRTGDDGKPRELHVEKARDVMNFSSEPPDKVVPQEETVQGGTRQVLVSSDKFIMERFMVASEIPLESAESFSIMSVLGGSGSLSADSGDMSLSAGDSLLVPACTGQLSLSTDTSLTVIRAGLPF